ncbi:MAG TPA: DUF523 domain-containing protein [Desulfomonilaceae bacterium]|nr:DUF523 domain-containing protein [Desulfomonilaceae bacterium]
MRTPVLISACLAGLHTRYDGTSRPHPELDFLAKRAILVPVCPELLGGLGIPRPPCYFSGRDGVGVLAGAAVVVDANGVDRTPAFVSAAEEVARIVKLVQAALIVFKEGSPSCGLRRVDIDGIKQPGCGVVTAFLRASGIPIISEEDPLPPVFQRLMRYV